MEMPHLQYGRRSSWYNTSACLRVGVVLVCRNKTEGLISLLSAHRKSIFRVCLDRTYFAETENLLLKSL